VAGLSGRMGHMIQKRFVYLAFGYLVMRWMWKHVRTQEDMVERFRAAGAI
jgi:hypothetical protein